MSEEMLTINGILGISDARAKEISKEILDEMSKHELVADGIEAIGTTHRLESFLNDPVYEETIYRGMCLSVAVNMNRKPKARFSPLAPASLN